MMTDMGTTTEDDHDTLGYVRDVSCVSVAYSEDEDEEIDLNKTPPPSPDFLIETSPTLLPQENGRQRNEESPPPRSVHHQEHSAGGYGKRKREPDPHHHKKKEIEIEIERLEEKVASFLVRNVTS